MFKFSHSLPPPPPPPQWRQHCELTTALLKQDGSDTALPSTEQQLRGHTERIERLEQKAATVLQEAQRLADLMEEVTKQALDSGTSVMDSCVHM